MTKSIKTILVAAVLGGAASVVNAAIVVPTGLNPGDKYHLVFVTSTTRDATSTAIADYNAFVQFAANAAGIGSGDGVDWFAIGSTATVAAKDNAPVTGSIYLLDGTLVAANSGALWGTHGDPGGVVSLSHVINLTEYNVTLAGYTKVWTGTNPNGTSADGTFVDAEEGGAGDEFGGPLGTTATSRFRPMYGDANGEGRHWVTEYAEQARTGNARFYALSEELTVQSVPEPGTMGLLGLASVALLLRRRRKN